MHVNIVRINLFAELIISNSSYNIKKHKVIGFKEITEAVSFLWR
jgi:hypothetical protein